MGVWDWDTRSNRVEWSDQNFRIFGLEPGKQKLDESSFLTLVYPEDRADRETRDSAKRFGRVENSMPSIGFSGRMARCAGSWPRDGRIATAKVRPSG